MGIKGLGLLSTATCDMMTLAGHKEGGVGEGVRLSWTIISSKWGNKQAEGRVSKAATSLFITVLLTTELVQINFSLKTSFLHTTNAI